MADAVLCLEGIGASSDGAGIFVVGSYRGAVDFDADEAVDVHRSSGVDAFVVALDGDGRHRSVRTWGGIEDDRAAAAAMLPGDRVIVAGGFGASVDFALASENDVRASRGHADSFLTAFPCAFSRADRTERAPPPVCRARADGLASTFVDCTAHGGGTYGVAGAKTCQTTFCQGEASYEACVAAGGGQSAIDGDQATYCCKVVYPENGCPCFGNACD